MNNSNLKVGSKPDPNSRIRRAAAILSEKGDMSVHEYQRVLVSLCETKQQWKNLNGDLVKAGLVERVVRAKVAG